MIWGATADLAIMLMGQPGKQEWYSNGPSKMGTVFKTCRQVLISM